MVVFSKTIKTALPNGIKKLFATEDLDTAALSGNYTLNAKLVAAGGSVIAENSYEFDIFSGKQLAAPKNRVAVLDSDNSLKPFLEASGIAYSEFDGTSDPSVPVLVSKTAAETDVATRRDSPT